MNRKKIQIVLRYEIEKERELIEHLESIGSRTGEAKRLLLKGYKNTKENNENTKQTETVCDRVSKSDDKIKPKRFEVKANLNPI